MAAEASTKKPLKTNKKLFKTNKNYWEQMKSLIPNKSH
jgi:hypothetical protein